MYFEQNVQIFIHDANGIALQLRKILSILLKHSLFHQIEREKNKK